ncbi:hypothetical protein GCM10010519_38340 [Streptomyces lactacystinicus]
MSRGPAPPAGAGAGPRLAVRTPTAGRAVCPARPAVGADQSTISIWPIMPAEECSSMWQWYM